MRLAKLLSIATLLVGAMSVHAQTLNVGDPAPALSVTDWVKGNPTKEFKKGEVYVVEFWATWCGPCKVSIPHLSELAKKYSKVNFIGVSIWESAPEDYKTKVPAFVKSMGDKMAYNVATEGPDTAMAKNWMMAAGENGIPSSFIVNQEGKIAWIGHPMDGLGETLEQVLAGNYDVSAARDKRAKDKAAEMEAMKAQMEMQKEMKPFSDAMKKKDYKAAIKIIDAVIAKHPDEEAVLLLQKLNAHVGAEDPATAALLKKIGSLPELGDNPMYLNNAVWAVVEKPHNFSKAVYAASAEIAAKMEKLAPNEGNLLDTVALAYFRAGDKKKALATQKKAIAMATKAGEDAQTLKELKERLVMYGG